MRRLCRITFLLTFLLLAGCGDNPSTVLKDSHQQDYAYEPKYHFFHTEDSSPYAATFGEDGTVYFAVYENRRTRLYFLPLGATEPGEIPLKLEEGTWITCLLKEPDRYDENSSLRQGNLLLACGRYEEDLEQMELIQISPELEIVESIDVTEVFRALPGFEARTLLTDEAGNYYIANGKNIFVLDPDGTLKDTLRTEENVADLFYSAEGTLPETGQKDASPQEAESQDTGLQDTELQDTELREGKLPEVSLLIRYSDQTLGEILPEEKKLRPVNRNPFFLHGIYGAGTTDRQEGHQGILFSSGNTLYSCDVKDDEPVEVLHWTDCDVDSKNLKCLTVLKDGRIAALLSRDTMAGASNEIVLLTRKKRTEIPQKTVITYGCAWLNSVTGSQIIRFNKQNDNYRIEVKEYGDQKADLKTRRLLLQKELLAGKGPDLIDMGILSAEDHTELIDMGILEDLNPYFADGSLKREDYLDKILHVYERDDCLYAVMPGFQLNFLVGRAEDMGDGIGWNLEETMDFVEKQPKGVELLSGVTAREMLKLLCQLNRKEFMDESSGACSFNDPSFERVLDLAAHFPVEQEEDEWFDWPSRIEKIRDRRLLLLQAGAISVLDLQEYSFIFDGPIGVKGYPAESGNGVMALPCSSVVGINSGSDEKRAAWEYIRFLLSDDQQKELAAGALGFPLKKSALSYILERETKKEYQEGKNGQPEEKPKTGVNLGDITLDLYAATTEEADLIVELIDAVGNSIDTEMQPEMLKIMEEEAAAFFEGHKSAKEAAEIIQNRMQLYMEESIQ